MKSATHYTALRIYREQGTHLESIPFRNLGENEVLIAAEYSSVNYKDALAITGWGKILHHFPMTPGIDVAGTVHRSNHPEIAVDTKVLVTGCGLGERFDGGFAEYAQVSGDIVLPCPDQLNPRTAMIFGTAGFTAALAIQRMEDNHQSPDQGPVLVTGASGGVGSMAVALLAARGYEVSAMTHRISKTGYLHALGATTVLDRHKMTFGKRPLESVEWAGAIDSVGGETLSWLTRTLRPGGNIATIGLAGGQELNTTVMPFILRGINLLGINSVNSPMSQRQKIWEQLSTALPSRKLEFMLSDEITLNQITERATRMLQCQTQGRCLVKLA